MSHETMRDLRQVGPAGPPRVRGPVRDRPSTEPEPDQDLAGKPRRIGWRIAATVFLVALLIGVGVLLVIDEPPVDCGRLAEQSRYRSDVAADMTDAGCADLDPTAGP